MSEINMEVCTIAPALQLGTDLINKALLNLTSNNLTSTKTQCVFMIE